MLRYFRSLSIYKWGVWLYLLLLIFEGALRKWFLPGFATPLLVVRDPIVIWLVLVGLSKGWLNNRYVYVVMAVSTISLLSIPLSHANLWVGLFGWRIYFFHLPFIFVIGRLFDREDLLWVGKILIYLSIPMTALVVTQFYSSPTDWVNIGIGGEGTAGFGGAMGYMRPPGTFSFISGYVAFQAVVGGYLLYYLFSNRGLTSEHRLPVWLLYVALGCYIITIPTSISRTHFFQTIVLLLFVSGVAIFNRGYRIALFGSMVVLSVAFVVVNSLGLIDDSLMAFVSRFESASISEGGLEGTLGDRYVGGLLRGLFDFSHPPFGYGIGIATNVGSSMLGIDMWHYFDGENEWGRVVGECGLLLGWTIISVRLLISFWLFRLALRSMRSRGGDLMPWFLSAPMLLMFPQGQMAIPTNLGFCILSAGLVIASLKVEGGVVR